MIATFGVDPFIIGKSEQLSSQIVGTDCLLIHGEGLFVRGNWLIVLDAIRLDACQL